MRAGPLAETFRDSEKESARRSAPYLKMFFPPASPSQKAVNQSLPQDVDANGVPIVDVDNNPVTIRYPNTNLGNRLKAAIRLAIPNPDRRDQPAPSTCLRNV